MPSSENKKLTIALIFFSLSVIAFAVLVNQVVTQSKRLDEQTSLAKRQQAEEADRFKLKRQVADTIEERSQVESYFFRKEEEDSLGFLTYVESDLAKRAGVFIETKFITVKEDKADETKWVEVMFVFSGTKDQVFNFVEVLENMPYALRIPSVTLNAKSSQYWEAEVLVAVNLWEYDGKK
jgi:hypothetical protein